MEKNKKKGNIIDFPRKKSKLEREIEAIIFAAEEPLDIETIEKRVGSTNNIKKILENLQKEYLGRGINLACVSNKWIFRTATDLSKLMSLQKSTQKKLSKATIETLAIIVYHQPVTRTEIEEIRGVAIATNTMEILLELDWVRPAGRKDVPGKPILYVTTENFLNHFNIQFRGQFLKFFPNRIIYWDSLFFSALCFFNLRIIGQLNSSTRHAWLTA